MSFSLAAYFGVMPALQAQTSAEQPRFQPDRAADPELLRRIKIINNQKKKEARRSADPELQRRIRIINNQKKKEAAAKEREKRAAEKKQQAAQALLPPLPVQKSKAVKSCPKPAEFERPKEQVDWMGAFRILAQFGNSFNLGSRVLEATSRRNGFTASVIEPAASGFSISQFCRSEYSQSTPAVIIVDRAMTESERKKCRKSFRRDAFEKMVAKDTLELIVGKQHPINKINVKHLIEALHPRTPDEDELGSIDLAAPESGLTGMADEEKQNSAEKKKEKKEKAVFSDDIPRRWLDAGYKKRGGDMKISFVHTPRLPTLEAFQAHLTKACIQWKGEKAVDLGISRLTVARSCANLVSDKTRKELLYTLNNQPLPDVVEDVLTDVSKNSFFIGPRSVFRNNDKKLKFVDIEDSTGAFKKPEIKYFMYVNPTWLQRDRRTYEFVKSMTGEGEILDTALEDLELMPGECTIARAKGELPDLTQEVQQIGDDTRAEIVNLAIEKKEEAIAKVRARAEEEMRQKIEDCKKQAMPSPRLVEFSKMGQNLLKVLKKKEIAAKKKAAVQAAKLALIAKRQKRVDECRQKDWFKKNPHRYASCECRLHEDRPKYKRCVKRVMHLSKSELCSYFPKLKQIFGRRCGVSAW